MTKKTLGKGTLSLLLAFLGIAWSFAIFGVSWGDNILTALGLMSWSNGNSGIHFTVYYALVFFIPAFLLGLKYKNNFGAKAGKIIGAVMGVFIIAATLFVAV